MVAKTRNLPMYASNCLKQALKLKEGQVDALRVEMATMAANYKAEGRTGGRHERY
jgi:hypothetical protein